MDLPFIRCHSTQILNQAVGMHFTSRVVPQPECMLNCQRVGPGYMNPAIFVAMQGECEFLIGGVLEFWCITNRLGTVNVPTLVLVGEFDSMSVECSQTIVDAVPTAWPLVVIPRAAHCKLVDEPYECVTHCRRFLDTCESARNCDQDSKSK